MSSHGMFFDSKNNDRQYGAESFREWCRSLFSNGIAKNDNGEYGFSVTSAGERKITISPGVAFINGAIKVVKNPITIDVPEFHGSGSHVYKNVVIEFNSDRDTRNIIITTDGPSSGEVQEPVRNDSRWQLVIARIYCQDSSVRNNILPEDITDTRNDEAICGFMRCSVNETNMSELANTLRNYMSSFGEAAQTKYDNWFSNISNKIDQTIFDILDGLNASFNSLNQLSAEVSNLNGPVANLKSDASNFASEYVSILDAPAISDLGTALSNIKIPLTGSFSWDNLKKLIVTFKFSSSWKDYKNAYPDGISIILSKYENPGTSSKTLTSYYNLFVSNGPTTYSPSSSTASGDATGLDSIFLYIYANLTMKISNDGLYYIPFMIELNTNQFYTGAIEYEDFFSGQVFYNPLSEGYSKSYSEDTIDSSVEISNLKVTGIF